MNTEKTLYCMGRNCKHCSEKNCPRRSALINDNMQILSEHRETTTSDVMCVDIGTTTIAMTGGGGVYRAVNPQRCFGADVLSRIQAANTHSLDKLKELITSEILRGMKFIYGDTVPKEIIVSANTAMVHFLMGWDCSGLGQFPFTPISLDTQKTELAGNIPMTVIGGVSAYVGGDIVSGIYSCGMAESEDISLFVDLGTNGEIALGNCNKIIATSTAAGPAFEGGEISCGCASVSGAICGIDGENIKTIDNAPPIGICGTGLVEVVYELLQRGISDKTGLLNEKYFENGYTVTDKIKFTQMDMRQVQMAKAAVAAGIEILLEEYKITMNEVKNVYLSGGFGFGLNLKKTEGIGLLPKGTTDKAIVLGNSSLDGAIKYSLDAHAEEKIKKIKAISTDILLGGNEYFSQRYIENINFI